VNRCLPEILRSHFRLLPAGATAVAPLAALAAQPAATQIGTSLLQVALALALVLALLAGALFVLRRLAAPRRAAAGALRIVGATSLGPRERVVLVEIGETWLVLGVAPGRVSALHSLPRLAQNTPETGPAPGSDFAAWLGRITERNRGGR